jgi:hypothetical protein
VTAQQLLGVAGIVLTVSVLVGVLLGRTVKAEVGSVKAEFRNNGGSTLRDAVDLIRRDQLNIHGAVDRIESNQGDVLGRLDAHGEELARLSERVAALEAPKPAPIRKAAAKPLTPRKKAS